MHLLTTSKTNPSAQERMRHPGVRYRTASAFQHKTMRATQPTGPFDCNTWPGFSDACPVRAMQTQYVGEDGDRVVSLEGSEGRGLGEPLAQGYIDVHTEWAEMFGRLRRKRVGAPLSPGNAVLGRDEDFLVSWRSHVYTVHIRDKRVG